MTEDEKERFEGLWRDHQRDVARFAVRRLPRHEDPSDLVSDVFLAAWRRLDSISHDPQEARVWLLGAARRSIANRQRGMSRRRALETRLCELGAAEPEDWLGRDASTSDPRTLALVGAFNEMSAKDREAIALVTWEELTPSQAAEVLEISSSRFRVRLHRAKKRLRLLAVQRETSVLAKTPALNDIEEVR